MAYADATGTRGIFARSLPIPLVLKSAVSVKQGDLLGYSSGWCLADANAGIPAKYIAGDTMTGDGYKIVNAYKAAIVSGVSGATAGNPAYLSDTAGGYGESASTTSEQKVGVFISATEMYVEPDQFNDKFTVSYVAAAAANVPIPFFIATRRCRVTKISEVHVTACDAADPLTIERLQGTEAAGSGDDLLGDTKIQANGTANTVQSPALTSTATALVLEVGNRLCGKITSGDGTSLASACFTVELERA